MRVAGWRKVNQLLEQPVQRGGMISPNLAEMRLKNQRESLWFISMALWIEKSRLTCDGLVSRERQVNWLERWTCKWIEGISEGKKRLFCAVEVRKLVLSPLNTTQRLMKMHEDGVRERAKKRGKRERGSTEVMTMFRWNGTKAKFSVKRGKRIQVNVNTYEGPYSTFTGYRSLLIKEKKREVDWILKLLSAAARAKEKEEDGVIGHYL